MLYLVLTGQVRIPPALINNVLHRRLTLVTGECCEWRGGDQLMRAAGCVIDSRDGLTQCSLTCARLPLVTGTILTPSSLLIFNATTRECLSS